MTTPATFVAAPSPAPPVKTLDVFGWAADETGCGYYRIQLPLGALVAHGHTTGHGMRLPRHARDNPATVIVGQRVANPGPSTLWQSLAAEGRRLVYELDDDLLNVDHTSPQAWRFFGQPEIQANIKQNIEVAAAVTVSTQPLADAVRPYNPNVHVVPNYIPGWLLDWTPPRRDDGVLTIGWGGSATHNMDFEQAAPQLKRFLTRTPDVEFHCIGSNYGNWMRIPQDRCRFTGWVPGVDAFLRTIDYHVGIAPLRPHVFNQSKSALKALECAALGIPIVASAVRPYEDFVQDGVTGFLVRRDHEWQQYLRALVEDPAMREQLGAAARAQAADHTVEGNVHLWEKAILG